MLFRSGVCRDFGFATDLDALRAIAQALVLPVIDLTREQPSRDLLTDFPIRLIHRHSIFPVSRTDQSLRIVLSNPFDVQAADAVAEATGLFVSVCTAMPAEVAGLIKLHLGVGAQTLDGLMAQAAADDEIEVLGDLSCEDSEVAAMAQQASVVRLVNDILTEAVTARASDIHMESQAAGMKIRYRIDGVLQNQPVPSELNRFQAAILSRLKIDRKSTRLNSSHT